MTVDTVHTLVGAYVLDAVDDTERAAVERHLAECDECAAEVVSLREAVAGYAASAAVEPPPGLRERVRAQVGRTRQVPPSVARTSRPRGPRRGRRWLPAVAAVAACLVLVAGGVVAWTVQQRSIAVERASADAAEQRAMEAERRELAVREVLAAPDARVQTTEVTGGGQIVVVVSQRKDQAVVAVSDLRQMPADRTYQLWVVRQRPLSAGVLDAGETGSTQLVTGLREARKVCLTVEPAGGSNQPTTSPVVIVDLE